MRPPAVSAILLLQKLRRPLMPEVTGDVGGGLAAVILEVELGAVLDQQS
jgi:hypothetical protein